VNVASLVEAVSAGIGASAIVGSGLHRYWRKREVRQQAEFEAAVSRIVDAKIGESEKRIMAAIRQTPSRRQR